MHFNSIKGSKFFRIYWAHLFTMALSHGRYSLMAFKIFQINLQYLIQTMGPFLSSYQTTLMFSESDCQPILHTFPEFIPINTDIFRELLANNTTNFSRFYTIITQYRHFQRVTDKQFTLHFFSVYIKQYWHFQRVPSKLKYSKNFFQSSYHTILTFRNTEFCHQMFMSLHDWSLMALLKKMAQPPSNKKKLGSPSAECPQEIWSLPSI